MPDTPGPGPAGAEQPTKPPTPKGFWVIWSTVALDQIVFAMILPVLPLLAKTYGASAVQITALVSVFALAQFLVSPFVGALSDRYGRKPILVISLFGSALGSLIVGLAGALPLIFLGRAVDGFSGTALVSAQTAVTDMVGPRHRARFLGLMGSAFAVGFIVGPALSLLASLVNARLPYFIAAGLALVNAVVAIVRLPETRPVAEGEALAREHAGGNGDRSPFAVFRNAGSLRPATWFYIAVLAGALLAFASVEGGTFTLLANDRLGFDASAVAGVFVWIGFVLALVQVRLVGPANARLGIRLAIGAALGLNVIGFAVLAAAGRAWVMLAGVTLFTVGQGLIRPTCTTAVSNSVDPRYRGLAIGTQTSAQGLVRIVGPLIAGALYAGVGVGAPFAVAAAISAVVAAMVLTLGTRWDAAVAGA